MGVKNISGKYLLKAMLFLAWLFLLPKDARAVNYLIINEIATGQTGAPKNEFIELYNPTENPLVMNGFKLTKKTRSGAESNLISSVKFSGTIPAHGYWLISSPEYKDAIAADLVYSGTTYSVADDNTVLLYDQLGNLLDKVGYGEVADFEAQAALNPGNDKSLERNNFSDADNNYNDFKILDKPTPRNSSLAGGSPPAPQPEPPLPPDPPVYSRQIRINEILPNPSQIPERSFEFVEIYNFSDGPIDLDGWKIKDKTGEYKLSGTISAQNYAVFYDTVTLNNDGDEIRLYDPNGELVHLVVYSENAKNDLSWSFDDEGWRWSSFPTSGGVNIFRKDYPEGVYLNEILSQPAGSAEEEYVELYNSSEKDINLSGWALKDSSKASHYVFPQNTIIKSGDFLVIYRKDYKFALNDSGAETVSLLDPNEKVTSSFSYSGSNEGASYNFDDIDWHMSRHLTPGAKNIFNNLPDAKTEDNKSIYAGIFADFSAKASDKDKDKLRYIWDFGDGHKSYKKETRHKYEKAGKYTVTLKIFDGSEEKIETININVKKYPERAVKIIKVVPNPAGNDSENEYIVVKNLSGKKINLKNWIVATGGKKLYNHPIANDLFVGAGDAVQIGRKDSKFTLNNKKGKIELHYPNGKMAYSLKYDSGAGGAEEDAAYEKTDAGWQWTETEEAAEKEPEKTENIQETITQEPSIEAATVQAEEVQTENSNAGGETAVLGAEDTKPENKNSFDQEVREKNTHGFFKGIGFFINYLLNRLINVFH